MKLKLRLPRILRVKGPTKRPPTHRGKAGKKPKGSSSTRTAAPTPPGSENPPRPPSREARSSSRWISLFSRKFAHLSHVSKLVHKQQLKHSIDPLRSIPTELDLKGYTSFSQFGKDLTQPFRGLGNIAIGIAHLVIALPYFQLLQLFAGINAFLTTRKERDVLTNSGAQFLNIFMQQFALAVSATFSWIVHGTSYAAKGTFQILNTPLTWLLKIPLRLLLISEGFARTFKPYDNVDAIRHDFVQPLRGIGHLLQATSIAFLYLPIFLGTLLKRAMDPTTRSELRQSTKADAIYLLTSFKDAFVHIIRGLTDIILTPLTWIIRIPLRLTITGLTTPRPGGNPMERWLGILFLFNRATSIDYQSLSSNLLKPHSINLPYIREQLLGGLRPLLAMHYGLTTTTRTYRSIAEVGHDFSQPIRGIKNLLIGIAHLAITPLWLVTAITLSPFVSAYHSLRRANLRRRGDYVSLQPDDSEPVDSDINNATWHKATWHRMKSATIASVSWILLGLTSTLRGATQLLTTPLTYALRIPFRLLLISDDFHETFRPWDPIDHVKGDVLQTQRGATNFIKGVNKIFHAPIKLLGAFFKGLRSGPSLQVFDETLTQPNPNKESDIDPVRKSKRRLGYGLIRILHGAIQLLTLPLVLAVKIPLRAALTGIRGFANLEKSRTFNTTLDAATEAHRTMSAEASRATRYTDSLIDTLFPEYNRGMAYLIHKLSDLAEPQIQSGKSDLDFNLTVDGKDGTLQELNTHYKAASAPDSQSARKQSSRKTLKNSAKLRHSLSYMVNLWDDHSRDRQAYLERQGKEPAQLPTVEIPKL